MSFNIDNRPKTFDEIIGNRDTVESLQSLLQQKDCPHTFMFYGMTGCGKTTLARIVAHELGCSDYDLIEINISNNRGIDTARDIITQMQYKPLNGKVKVYLLDEVHKATNEFQNAMLKPTEDIPNHVYFIFCTTDPQKVIPTLKNRCSQFRVNSLNVKSIMRLLRNVLEEKKKKVSDDVLEHIGKESEGIPRQALIMLQQVIDIKDDEKAIKIIQSVKTDEKQIIDLCRALNEGKSWPLIAGIIKGIEAEPENIRRAVLGYFSGIALNSKDKKFALRAAVIIENFADNYYDSGKAGLILSAFRSVMN